MTCPHCGEEMIVLELDQVEIDYCLACGGIWLDAGELEMLLDGGVEKDQMLSSFQSAQKVRERKKRCPICRKKMEKTLAGHNHETVLLDRCPRGHGLWFDGGELQQVLSIGGLAESSKVVILLKDMFGNHED